MVRARTSARSMSERPLVGSSSKPREAGFSEMAMASREDSRRRNSSMMVDQRSTGNEVAYGSARQIYIESQRGGKFLHAQHHGALLRRESAFQQKHIVWHCAPSASGCPR